MPALPSTNRHACFRRSFARPANRTLSILLCLLLLIFGTTVQVTHAHPLGESHADCSLCITAHSTGTVAVPQIALLPPAALIEAASQPPLAPRFELHRAYPLSSRPPPPASSVA